ncbi:NUDIX hydrolase [Actinomyces sp.]|uniref:NUDIX domain-containing protein n=1 Tax=Actinomyces sp. TaxID=29317 RepID=UPI0025C22B81|nr:NUDIX hydrolase [Actinomyces sp.]
MHFLSSEQVRAIADQPSPHTVASSEVVWSGRIVDMVEDRVVVVEGEEPVVRQYTRHPGAVAVVVMRGEEGAEEILLERQYRHPVNASLWEIPAGLLDIPGEDPLVAAERELAEEADLAARRWDVLVDFFTSPGGSTEPLRVFLARDLEATGTTFEREDGEATLKYAWVALSTALEWVLAGRLHHASTVIGILSAHAARGRGWEGLREPGAPWLR